MTFLGIHRKRINKRMPIAKRAIRKGDIIFFRYEGKQHSGTYMSLVLSIWPVQAKMREKKIHALSLNNLSLPLFKRLIRSIGTPGIVRDEIKKMSYFRVLIPEGRGVNEKFYRQKIRRVAKRADVYRTFNLKDIKTPKLVDYLYDEKIVETEDED